MLAVFQYSPIPFWLRLGEGQPGFVLEGDTYETLAWDMVEMFFDGFMTQETFATPQCGMMSSGPGMVWAMGADDFDPNLSRTKRYHEARFTPGWWKRQEYRWASFFGNGAMGGTGLRDFERRYAPDALLALYLTAMIGKYYAEFHGMPQAPLTARAAIQYFDDNRYLHWLDESDPLAIEKLVLGLPRPNDPFRDLMRKR